MKKPELAAAVAAQTGMTRNTAGETISIVLDQITDALARGEQVTLPGFGSFRPVSRAARTGVNPQTGATLHIAASKSASFRAGKALKEAIAGN
ncbi:MAG: HU family DNA-binding protein [Pseudomonadales bacterium]|nr:HU family DNA-binding protein [Pseudomonadales bacterium]